MFDIIQFEIGEALGECFVWWAGLIVAEMRLQVPCFSRFKTRDAGDAGGTQNPKAGFSPLVAHMSDA